MKSAAAPACLLFFFPQHRSSIVSYSMYFVVVSLAGWQAGRGGCNVQHPGTDKHSNDQLMIIIITAVQHACLDGAC